MCFDRNINGNRDVIFFECDYLPVQYDFKKKAAPILQPPGGGYFVKHVGVEHFESYKSI